MGRSGPKPQYILTKNLQYAPDGPFALGTVLTRPLNPESVIDGYALIPFPDDISVHSSVQLNYKDRDTRVGGGKYGIFTKFLSVLGVGIDLSVHRSGSSDTGVCFDRLETTYIRPTESYFKQIVEDPEVRTFINKKRFQQDLYVVTGIKTAFGVKNGHDKNGTKKEFDATLELDATPLGVPGLKAGPDIKWDSEHRRDISFESASDFIYAYRLKRLRCSRRTAAFVAEDYEHGELHGLDSGRGNPPDVAEGEGMDDIDVVWVADDTEEYKGQCTIEEVVDDDEDDSCKVVVPTG